MVLSLAAAVLAVAIAQGPGGSAEPSPGAARSAVSYDGIVSAEQDVRVAFTVAGAVESVQVKPGDRVKAGQTLLVLDDAVGAAQIDLYRLRAESELSIQAAEKQWKLSQVEENLVKEALAKGSAGQFEADRATLRAQLAGIELEKARQDRREAELALRQSQASHRLRTLVSPIDGVVEEVAVRAGESTEAARPVARVVSTGQLRIDVNPPTGETIGLKVGDSAKVSLPAKWFEGGRTPAPAAPGNMVATITHIAQVADARSGTRLVRLILDNPGGLPAGGQVRVTFQ